MFYAQIHPKSIPNIVGVSLSTVYNVKKTIDMGNSIQRKSGSGVVNNKQNQDFVDALKTKIAKDSTASIRKIAAELKVDHNTVITAKNDTPGNQSTSSWSA